MTPKEWNLVHNLAKQHETKFSPELKDNDEGPDFWGGSGASFALGIIKTKLETYLGQHGHRERLLREEPRVFGNDETTPQKILSGLVSEYNRNKELSKQVMRDVEVELEFPDDQVKLYGEVARYVQDNLKEMKTKNGVKQIILLATMELRFWHGCDVTWPPAQSDSNASGAAAPVARRDELALSGLGGSDGSQKPVAAAAAAAAEEEDEESEEDEEDDGGELPDTNFVGWDPEDPLSINWDRIKYTSIKKMAAAHEFHAISLMFFFDKELAAKFPDLLGQVHNSWQAHYKRPMDFKDIMRPPDEGPSEYDDDDTAWLTKTASFYLGRMSLDEREVLGISGEEAGKYVPSGSGKDRNKVMRCLIFFSTSEPRADDGG
jgi:hypothetical protein